jgi:hypothetical protein
VTSSSGKLYLAVILDLFSRFVVGLRPRSPTVDGIGASPETIPGRLGASA